MDQDTQNASASTENEAIMKRAFEQAPAGMMVVDPNGVIRFVNRSLADLFGHEPGELSGLKAEMLLAERFRADFADQFGSVVAINERRVFGALDLVYGLRKGQVEFSIEMDMTIIQLQDRCNILLTIIDITERLKAQALIDHAMKELRRSNGDLQQFAYAASHDLQTPLRHITSFIELLTNKLNLEEDEQARLWIKFITEATINMRALIDDLLAYSRVRAGQQGLEKVDLAALWALVASSAKQDRPDSILEADQLPVVVGLQNHLLQLFQNLVQNSLKFTPQSVAPHVSMKVKDQGTHYLFECRDNGIGISSDHYERVFLLFQKLHSKEKYPGTGIGLAICKKVVEIHGGEIWIESKVGVGSSFFFTLKKNPDV
jgi:PAS domain S-box-containing protein